MIDAQWSNTHKDAIEKLANVLNKLVNIYPEFYYDKGDDTAKKVFENHIDGDVVLDFNTLENPSPWKNLFYNKKKI